MRGRGECGRLADPLPPACRRAAALAPAALQDGHPVTLPGPARRRGEWGWEGAEERRGVAW